MEITREQLIKMGFTEDTTNMFFPRLKKKGDDPEFLITVSKDYIDSEVNDPSWKMSGYRCDENGNIIRRVNVDGITTFEELKSCTDLCGLII